MKILLINHYVGSDKMGMEFRPYYIAREWAKNGHEPTMIGGSYSHLRKNQPKNLGWSSEEGIDWLWLWTNKYKSNGLMRFISMLLFMLQLILLAPYIALKVRPQFVIASSTYTIDIFPSWLIAKLSRAKLIFELHDLWPLSPMELGGYSKYHPFIMLMRFGEWFAYKFSDKIISILPGTYEHIKKDGVPRSKWSHVPNGIVVSSSKEKLVGLPKQIDEVVTKLRKEKKFLVGYAGSIGPANFMETIIYAANLLRDEKIAFLIVGDGSERSNIENMAKELGLDNVFFFGYILKNQIPSFQNSMDALTYCGKKSRLYEYGVSLNKTFEYMLAAKPIIQAFSAKNDVVTIANCGITVEAENSHLFADAILKISKMTKAKRGELGQNGYDYVIKHHDFAHLAEEFIKKMDS